MKLKISLTLLWISLSCAGSSTFPGDTVIYLFPGQGADHRQFRDLQFPAGYDTVHITYPVPDRHESLHRYAMRFLPRIDQNSPYILMGVSLGGMICTELTDTLEPIGTIIISSAKTAGELPGRYTFQKKVPVNRIIPKRLTKGGALALQGIVEPDRKSDPETFKDMLRKKDPAYLKWTVDMIIRWERRSADPSIFHIHGEQDHTIPVKNVTCDTIIEDGSHMMVLTRSDEISEILRDLLE